jgi:hypothetical protein
VLKFDQEAPGLGAPVSPAAGLAIAPASLATALAAAPTSLAAAPASLAAAPAALAADSGAGVSSDFWHAVAAKNIGTRAKIRNLRITSSFFFRAGQNAPCFADSRILYALSNFKLNQSGGGRNPLFCFFSKLFDLYWRAWHTASQSAKASGEAWILGCSCERG